MYNKPIIPQSLIILIMHKSTSLVLVVGIFIILGVIVLADGITPILKSEKEVNNSAIIANNTSEQAEILVRFNPDLWNTTALQTAANASHSHIRASVEMDYDELGLSGLQLILLPPGMSVEDGVAYYENFPYVLYAEPNAVYSIENSKNQVEPQVTNESTSSLISEEMKESPTRLLIQFNVSQFSDEIQLNEYANKTHVSLNATLVKDYTPVGLFGLHLVDLPSNMTVKEGVGLYSNASSVLFAEPDYQIRLDEPEKA